MSKTVSFLIVLNIILRFLSFLILLRSHFHCTRCLIWNSFVIESIVVMKNKHQNNMQRKYANNKEMKTIRIVSYIFFYLWILHINGSIFISTMVLRNGNDMKLIVFCVKCYFLWFLLKMLIMENLKWNLMFTFHIKICCSSVRVLQPYNIKSPKYSICALLHLIA